MTEFKFSSFHKNSNSLVSIQDQQSINIHCIASYPSINNMTGHLLNASKPIFNLTSKQIEFKIKITEQNLLILKINAKNGTIVIHRTQSISEDWSINSNTLYKEPTGQPSISPSTEKEHPSLSKNWNIQTNPQIQTRKQIASLDRS